MDERQHLHASVNLLASGASFHTTATTTDGDADAGAPHPQWCLTSSSASTPSSSASRQGQVRLWRRMTNMLQQSLDDSTWLRRPTPPTHVLAFYLASSELPSKDFVLLGYGGAKRIPFQVMGTGSSYIAFPLKKLTPNLPRYLYSLLNEKICSSPTLLYVQEI